MGLVFLDDFESPDFPDPRRSDQTGLVAVSKELGPNRLLKAYQRGIFPWMKMTDPPYFWCWYSPDPRMVLYPTQFKTSRSLSKVLRDDRFEIKINQAFSRVMQACAETPRSGQKSTWIEKDMRLDYGILHSLGIAHSIEAYLQGRLVGGLYGLAMGGAFFGESMFHLEAEASKACVTKLVEISKDANFAFIDCQVPNPFLLSLGAQEVSRETFLDQLKEARPDLPSVANWMELGAK